jgi:hypothetical protein
MDTATDVFMVLDVGAGGYEVYIRFANGAILTQQGFEDEAAARAWAREKVPGATEVVRRVP